MDPGRALGRPGPDEEPSAGVLNDRATQTVLGRLHGGKDYIDVPAAMVIDKSDRLCFLPPADAGCACRPPGRSTRD